MKKISTARFTYSNTIGRLSLLILSLHMSQFACAQSSLEERWFQVELIAFKRQLQDQQEHWPTSVKMSYPENWVKLKDAGQQVSVVGATGNDVTDEDIESPPGPAYNAFSLLPAENQNLVRHAAALRRDSRYEVLFHEAWRQPVTARRAAPAIVIQGGADYGRHSELEGSITVSIAQILQINADLWLTWFAPNEGQASEWPPLPPTPTAPNEDFLDLPMSSFDSLAEDVGIAEPASSFTPEQPTEQALLDEIDPFLPVRIVQLKEERKLRSKELHYIDHPLLGLIVQITPYDPAAVTP